MDDRKFKRITIETEDGTRVIEPGQHFAGVAIEKKASNEYDALIYMMGDNSESALKAMLLAVRGMEKRLFEILTKMTGMPPVILELMLATEGALNELISREHSGNVSHSEFVDLSGLKTFEQFLKDNGVSPSPQNPPADIAHEADASVEHGLDVDPPSGSENNTPPVS